MVGTCQHELHAAVADARPAGSADVIHAVDHFESKNTGVKRDRLLNVITDQHRNQIFELRSARFSHL